MSLFAITASASIENYQRGYYYDLNGNRTDGYISHIDYSLIKFRQDLNTKPIKLTPSDIEKFYIGNDEYRVLETFKIKPDFIFFRQNVKKGFAKVLLEGRANLYLCRVYVNNGQIFDIKDYFLLENNNNKKYIQLHKNIIRFRKQIATILNDGQLDEMVKKRNWRYNQTELIIRQFNKP